MQFHILYCRPCGYRDRAEELAVELRGRFGAEVVVEEGKFGQFDVLLDGELVASKGGFWKRTLIHGGAAPGEDPRGDQPGARRSRGRRLQDSVRSRLLNYLSPRASVVSVARLYDTGGGRLTSNR